MCERRERYIDDTCILNTIKMSVNICIGMYRKY